MEVYEGRKEDRNESSSGTLCCLLSDNLFSKERGALKEFTYKINKISTVKEANGQNSEDAIYWYVTR